MRTTLFVAGFGERTRARDLAYEFERYGRLVRCDIPAPKPYAAKVYAFVEFEDPRDAEDAFNEMHGRRIDGYTISVQWARNAPSASWRYGGRTPPPPLPPPPPHLRRRSPLPLSPPPPHYHRRRLYGGRPPSAGSRSRSPPYHHHRRSPSRGRSPIRRYSPLPLIRSASKSPPSLRHHSRSPSPSVLDSK
ncbi:RNA-binding domain-containing protein [Backusella circina FSU 941]|nr:RNA-binding domain-containing protein [Backusella circina FSU 941]